MTLYATKCVTVPMTQTKPSPFMAPKHLCRNPLAVVTVCHDTFPSVMTDTPSLFRGSVMSECHERGDRNGTVSGRTEGRSAEGL